MEARHYNAAHCPPLSTRRTSWRGESAQSSHHKWPLKADLPSKPPRFRFVTAEPQATHARLCFLRLTSCVFDQKWYALASSGFWNAVVQRPRSFFRAALTRDLQSSRLIPGTLLDRRDEHARACLSVYTRAADRRAPFFQDSDLCSVEIELLLALLKLREPVLRMLSELPAFGHTSGMSRLHGLRREKFSLTSLYRSSCR
jgi:hypothetical protein